MKKTLFLGCIAAMSMGFAEDSEAHRVSFGVDGYYIDGKGFHKKGEIDHRTDAIARGVKWGYDFIKPDSFYAGASGVVQVGNIRQHIIYYDFPYMDGDKQAYADLSVRHKYALEAKQAEIRSGATLLTVPELTITPFCGLSVRTTRIKCLDHLVLSADSSYDIRCMTTTLFEFLVGANTEYTLNEQLKCGLGVKRYQIINGRVHTGGKSTSFRDTKSLWEISVPFSYHFSCNKQDRFVVSFEPYLRKQFEMNGESAKGARLTLACDF